MMMMDDYFNDLPSALNILKDKSRYDIGSNGICNDINKYYIMLDDLNIWYNNRYNMIYIPRLTVIEGLDGSGKSTILRSIIGLDSISSGEIKFQTDVTSSVNNFDAHKKIGMVFGLIKNFDLK